MLSNDKFLEVVQAVPLVAIDLVVVRDKTDVLLGLRNNKPAMDCWFVPGGRIRKNEMLAAAFRRIGTSELGRPPGLMPASPIGVFEHFYEDCFDGTLGINTHYVVLAYRLDVTKEFELGDHDNQHSAMRWCPLHAAASDRAVHAYSRAYFTNNQETQ